MVITTSTSATHIREECRWDVSYPLGASMSSVPTETVTFSERIRIVDEGGKKKLFFSKDSFWGIPPLDLGNVRSDRLDDFLYGASP